MMLKGSFRVGDIVGINHKKMDPKQNFRVIKINAKNIKVQASDVVMVESEECIQFHQVC